MKYKIVYFIFLLVSHVFSKDTNPLSSDSKILDFKKWGNSSSQAVIVPSSNSNYNEIPYGVELISSEEDWLVFSPQKACCCYYMFDEKYKSLGLLYNLKAFEKIKKLLENQSSFERVCTDQQWDKIFSDLKNNRKTINQLNLNAYPGFYDEVWYRAEEMFAGYWVNDHTFVSFSGDNLGAPMIDDFIDTETSNGVLRNSILALSIRMAEAETNQCNESIWFNDVVNVRGSKNIIKFITKSSDWEKYYNETPCCCYINFDPNYEDYGLVYNLKAYELLKTDEELKQKGFRIATEKDWMSLIACTKNRGTYNSLFNCDETNYSGFNLHPNGYCESNSWKLPTDLSMGYWVGEGGEKKAYIFNCSLKEDIQMKENFSFNSFPGYMIRLINTETVIKKEKQNSVEFIKEEPFNQENKDTESVKDIEGNTYDIVKIKDQIWMAENLNVSAFQNGDPIPEAKTFEEWKNANYNQQPAWCYYNNDPANGVKYGKLYNWYAINDTRGLSPKGWRVPSKTDFDKLYNISGNASSIHLKSEDSWLDEPSNAHGTNNSGFNGLASGYRTHEGNYMGKGMEGSYWSANETELAFAWRIKFSNTNEFQFLDILKSFGFSVRCLKN